MWIGGACLFCLGAWVLQQQAQLPAAGWLLAFGAVALARTLVGEVPLGVLRVVDALLCLAAGFLWAALVAHTRLAAQMPHEWEGRDIRVEGVIAELPQAMGDGVRFTFDIDKVLTPLAPTLRRVQVHWAAPLDPPRAGEQWSLTLRLKRPRGLLNPHGFDREFWCLERGIQAVGYVHSKAPAARLEGGSRPPQYAVQGLRQDLRQRVLGSAGGTPAAGVLAALAIGDQGAISADQWDLFTRTGVGHLMSISGLHITMLSALAGWLAGLAWRRSVWLCARLPARKAALLCGLVAAAGYAALAGFGVPAQRTVIMLAAMVAALWWGRHISAGAVLAAALWGVTIVDPFSVRAPGFWLSFGAVALILYVSLGRLRPPAALPQWLRIQAALFLGLIPLTLALFQQFSLVAPLANAFAIPLVSLAVVPLTLLGLLLPVDGPLLLAERLMALCVWMLSSLDRGDWVTWRQAVPPAWSVLLAAVGAVWCLAPRGFPGRAVGWMALLPAFLAQPPSPAQGEYWMDVLDVGQGLSAVIRTRQHTLLYDAGPAYGPGADAGRQVVLPYLRAAGVASLDALVISHDDSDHTGGAAAVLSALPARWMSSSLQPDHVLHGVTRRTLPCTAGQHWQWDGVRFEFLHPVAGAATRPVKDNDRSCVLRVRGAGGVTLLPGDIEAPVERALAQRESARLSAHVLLAPHHGSGTSSTAGFLRAVSPATVIVTSGYRNRHGHPKAEVLTRYRQAGARVLRSDRDGAVLVRPVDGRLHARGWREVHRRYWYD